jgi:hypothetical protein
VNGWSLPGGGLGLRVAMGGAPTAYPNPSARPLGRCAVPHPHLPSTEPADAGSAESPEVTDERTVDEGPRQHEA